MTRLTGCFDGGVRYSFDVILSIHKEFSTAPVFLSTQRGKKGLCWLGDSLSQGWARRAPSSPFLSTITLSFCHVFKEILTPVPFQTAAKPISFPRFPLANAGKSLLLFQDLVSHRSHPS